MASTSVATCFCDTSKEVKNVLSAFPPFATTIFGLRLSRNFTRILAPFATSLIGGPLQLH